MNFKNTLFLWAAACCITTGAFAQVKKKPAATTHKTTPASTTQAKPGASAGVLPIDPDVLIGKLPNGLTYYIRKNSSPKGRADLLLLTKAGSVLETDAQQGLANFTQHMAFKGTRDFSKSAMYDFLKKTGTRFGPDTSAFTSYDETVYQLSVPTDTAKVFSGAFNLLANWASYMTFNPADINSQKALDARQAAAGGKTAQDRLQLQNLPVLLNNSKYAQRFATGKESTINAFSEATVKSFYTDWYRPNLQAVIAVGDFDPQQVLEMIKFSFSSLRNPSPEKPLPQYAVTPSLGTTVKVSIDKDFPYTLGQIVIRHPQTVVRTPADFLQNMRVTLFNLMMNNRIAELAQKPVPPMAFGQATYGSFAGKQDAFTALAVANNGNLEVAFKALVAELQRARKFGFTVTELERAKQTALAQISNSYRMKDAAPSSNFVGEYERNFLTGQAIPGLEYEYNYYVNNIGKITAEQMNALAVRFITDQNRVILIEGSDKDKDKLPNQQTVLKWVADADKGLTPYVDDSATPLMSKPPVPGKVVTSTTDSTILVQNITLSNGVKVILKPTTFTNNQILFTGYSFGGTSLASDQDYASANLAASVMTNSGVAGFNQEQLNKMLGGKSLSVNPYISDITQGVSGYSSADDFEAAMQLMYLYFTNPRKDAGVWQSTVNQAKSLSAHKSNDPGSVYQDTVLAVLNGYNTRALPATTAQLDATSLDKAYSFYKDRFADASNFTFTFTGAFTISAITPFLETYLGSLPSTNSKETFKNLGIHPPAGQITKTVYKGASDKATVQLVYSGTYDYNPANNTQMDALEEVLNIRLADSVKKESGVLSGGVRASYVKIPEGRYKITISFLCDANSVDKTVTYVTDEINKIKNIGPVAKDVQIYGLKEARSFQSQIKQNAFWEANLTSASQNQQDADKLLNHMVDVQNVTQQSVKETAVKYLNNSNLIKLILLPEKK